MGSMETMKGGKALEKSLEKRASGRWRRVWHGFLYGVMAFILAGLLFMVHLVSAIREGQNPLRRMALARQVAEFEVPGNYALSSALYAVHPRFFVLTREDGEQKIRVVERRWWARDRRPEEFRERFFHPGEWVRRPGMGYERMRIEETGEVELSSRIAPYVVGPLASRKEGKDRGMVLCLYDEGTDQSLYIFGSAQEEVFSASEIVEFAGSLQFE